jgi:hypothetical protein
MTDCIHSGHQVLGDLNDAVAALRIVEQLYLQSDIDALSLGSTITTHA